jgi:hypothetical protein
VPSFLATRIVGIFQGARCAGLAEGLSPGVRTFLDGPGRAFEGLSKNHASEPDEGYGRVWRRSASRSRSTTERSLFYLLSLLPLCFRRLQDFLDSELHDPTDQVVEDRLVQWKSNRALRFFVSG